MRLASLETTNGPAGAVMLDGDRFLLLGAAASAAGMNGVLGGGSIRDVIEGGTAALAAVRALIDKAGGGTLDAAIVPASQARLLSPIPVVAKNVFCVGRNYADHIAEGARAQKTNIAVTDVPVFFTKPPTSVVGPDAEVPIFKHISAAIDYEVELAVVIGTKGRDIAPDKAFDHIFGYTILNDITARDVQRRHGGQYFKGKALDGSCPIGPWIVTADEMTDPENADLRCYVNGELRQDGNTAQMIFDIPALIASLSEGLTLEPGDILATGTPSGVGYAMEPPCFLKDGDEVTCEIDGIGRLTNRMTAM